MEISSTTEHDRLQKTIRKITKEQGMHDVEDFSKFVKIVESFMIQGKFVCYGGTAINAHLPKKYQFYDFTHELPDYDFFSSDSLNDAKRLAYTFHDAGFKNIEAKAAFHVGTYKVSVDFVQVADITQIDENLLVMLQNSSFKKNGIMYASANYLRMELYKELSYPQGNVERWEKVFNRLNLLNKHVPLVSKQLCKKPQEELNTIVIYTMDGCTPVQLKNHLIHLGVVFIGQSASSMVLQSTMVNKQSTPATAPFFSVLAPDLDVLTEHMIEKIPGIDFESRPATGDLLPTHNIFSVCNRPILIAYSTRDNCHAYNVVDKIRVASLDTLMNFFLLFSILPQDIYNPEHMLCIAIDLAAAQKKNIDVKNILLRRFSMKCLGGNKTRREMMRTRNIQRNTLDRNSIEWDKQFLKLRM